MSLLGERYLVILYLTGTETSMCFYDEKVRLPAFFQIQEF
jgi:hypothetical protein